MQDNQQPQELVCEVSFSEGVYTISNEVSGIAALGNTIEEAQDAFESAMDALVDALAKDDTELTPDALELKEKMKPYMRN